MRTRTGFWCIVLVVVLLPMLHAEENATADGGGTQRTFSDVVVDVIHTIIPDVKTIRIHAPPVVAEVVEKTGLVRVPMTWDMDGPYVDIPSWVFAVTALGLAIIFFTGRQGLLIKYWYVVLAGIVALVAHLAGWL